MAKERCVLQNEKEVVYKFELTNNEWLRYRLVRQLPERGDFYLDQIYWTQTRPLAETRPFLTDSEVKNLRFKASFKEAAQVITALANSTLESDNPQITDISNLSTSLEDFEEIYNPQYGESHTLAPEICIELDKKAREWCSLLISATEGKSYEPEDEVEIIRAIFRLECLKHNRGGEPHIANDRLTAAFKQLNYPLLAAAIKGKDSRIVSMVYGSFWNSYLDAKRKLQPWGYYPRVIIQLLEPLLVTSKQAITQKDDLNNIRIYSGLVQVFLDDMVESKNIRESYFLKKENNLAQLADELLDTALTNFETSKKYFRHDSLVALFSMLTSLYKLGEQPTQISHERIYIGLANIYEHMVARYRGSTNPREHYDFEDLAEVLGLDMQKIVS